MEREPWSRETNEEKNEGFNDLKIIFNDFIY